MQSSSLLPAPSANGDGYYGKRPRRERGQPVLRAPRPEVPIVERQVECPYAARLYLVEATDIASRCQVCSRVLGLPPAVVIGPCNEEADAGTGSEKAKAAALKMVTCPIWRDTTLVELTFEALRAARPQADSAFEQRREARNADSSQNPAVVASPESEQTTAVRHAAATVAATSLTKREPLPVYDIEWFMGSVTVEGKAGVQALGAVELHQAVPGEPQTVFPVRRKDGVHYNSLLMDLSYRLGDPLLFTCTRRR